MGKEREFESFILEIAGKKRLVEIIFNGEFEFAYLGDEGVVLGDEKQLGSGHKLPDIEKDSVIKTGGILLAPGVTPYQAFGALRKEIEGHLRKYIKMDPKYYPIVAVFIIASWRYDSFSSMPFLRALGVPGSGKSRFIDVVGDLLYRRLKTSGVSSFSAIFRLCDKWKGSLALDESDMRDSSTYSPIVKYLNSRKSIDTPFFKTVQDNHQEQEAFTTYGPTILSCRHEYADHALESRCFNIPFEAIDSGDLSIPRVLPDEYYSERDKLLCRLMYYRLKGNKAKVEDVNRHVEKVKHIEPRLQELMLPLLEIAGEDKETEEEFIELAGHFETELKLQRQQSEEGLVFKALLEEIRSRPRDKITFQDVANRLNSEAGLRQPVKAKWVGGRLRSMNIGVGQRTSRGYVIVWDEKVLERQKELFGFGGLGEETVQLT